MSTTTLATMSAVTEPARLSNEDIAARLSDVANLLEEQRANQFRVQAWRHAAETLRALDRPAAAILRDEGIEGLDRLPGIGAALASATRELVETGRLRTLERLRGEEDPTAVLASVPGIGQVFARRIHERLGIESLEELEVAAHDGRLATLVGVGSKRLAGIQDALATRLRRRRAPAVEPPASVSELLDVDREYRDRAAAGQLPIVAPRRFNPNAERWLPVLHTTRGERHYTALFSNTPLAHRLDRTRDWVVIYRDGGDGERQCTVVTERRGPLSGRRVIRGRETECFAHYRAGRFRMRVPAA